jgi:flagellar basal-body rod protein FlgG
LSFFTGHVLGLGNAKEIHMLAAALRNQCMSLEVIASNLANIDTIAFKGSQFNSQDLTWDEQGQTKFLTEAKPVTVKRLFTQGKFLMTGNNLDLAIQANGFFEVYMPDGSLAYTRDGSFQSDALGRIVTSDGYPVMGFQTVPQGLTGISISPTGLVTYDIVGGHTMFQIQLVRFSNPGDLDAVSGNLFKQTAASGAPERGFPGEKGFGSLQQGYLESSNVSLGQEMARLIHAQHVYEVTLLALLISEKMNEADPKAKQ